MSQLTPSFYQHVAICTVMIILIALALGVFKPSRKKFISPALWTASDYFKYVKACILSSSTVEQLDKWKPLVEGYYDKHFRVPISTNERKRYYGQLLDTVSKKETELLKNQKVTA